MALPVDQAQRDRNLEVLRSAADSWFDEEEKRLKQENQFLRQVLQARGATQAAGTNLADVSVLVQDEIDAFLFLSV